MLSFEYDDNAGSPNKILQISSESPSLSWSIWGTVEEFAAVREGMVGGQEFLVITKASGQKIYWSKEGSSLGILNGDLEAWDFGIILNDDEERALLAALTSGPVR